MKKIFITLMLLATALVSFAQEANATSSSLVVRSGNTYTYGNSVMNKYQFEKWLGQQNCQPAYKMFTEGMKTATAGWVFLGTGLGLDVSAVVLVLCGVKNPKLLTGLAVASGCLEVACIPTIAVGYVKMHESAEVYNTACAKVAKAKPYWAIQASENGLGLAYHF